MLFRSNKTKYGDIPLLTSLNYNSWQRTVLRVLQEIHADENVFGEEDEAQPLDVNYKDYKKQTAKATNGGLPVGKNLNLNGLSNPNNLTK